MEDPGSAPADPADWALALSPAVCTWRGYPASSPAVLPGQQR